MLEQRLQPVLSEVRVIPDNPVARFEVVRGWFTKHTENLVDDVVDLTYLCTLPYKERSLLDHPVIGNFFLDRVNKFTPQTPEQRRLIPFLSQMVDETRFRNSHTDDFYTDKEGYYQRLDQFNSQLLKNPSESIVLADLMRNVYLEIGEPVYQGEMRRKAKYADEEYTTDLGHGLASPAGHFEFLTWPLRTQMESNSAKPLGLSIMVVDDQDAKRWYQRLIGVGFKEPEIPGYFSDAETALEALQGSNYDVILSDIELGEGKMDGIEFVKRAYDLQVAKKTKPRLSVFSYNDQRLIVAEEELREAYFKDKTNRPRVMHQVNYNNKTNFSAILFRVDVSRTMK